MHIDNVHVRLESPQSHAAWRGTLVAFAKANSLSAGQLFELSSTLETSGEATLTAYGADRYTLKKEAAKPSNWLVHLVSQVWS